MGDQSRLSVQAALVRTEGSRGLEPPPDLRWASDLTDRDRMIGWRVRSWDPRDRPAELVHLSGARLLPRYDELGRVMELGLMDGEPALRRHWEGDLAFTEAERQGLAQALESGASLQEALTAALEPLQVRAAERLKDLPEAGGPAWRQADGDSGPRTQAG